MTIYQIILGSYKDKKSIPEVQNIKRDHRDLVGKSSGIRSCVRVRHIPQARLLRSKLSSSLREVRFSEQEFLTSTLVSNIIYNYLGLQNNNLFYLFYNQLDYALAHYFAESEITKNNVDKFLSNLLIVLFTEKLFYQNVDKWMKKLLEIL